MSIDMETNILDEQVEEFDSIKRNSEIAYLESLPPAVREARNFFSFYGFLPVNDDTTIDPKLFHVENWFKEKLYNRFFFDIKKLPDDCKYVLAQDDWIKLVCVCDYKDVKKYFKNIQSSIAGYIGFQNIYNASTDKKVYYEFTEKLGGLGYFRDQDGRYESVFSSVKRYNNKAVICFMFVPFFDDLMESLNLKQVVETLEDEDIDVEAFLGFKHG